MRCSICDFSETAGSIYQSGCVTGKGSNKVYLNEKGAPVCKQCDSSVKGNTKKGGNETA